MNSVERVTTDTNVNVAEQSHVHALARPVKVPIRNWRADLLAVDRERGLACITSNVQPAVNVVERDAARRPSRFTDNSRNFVPLVLRDERPGE